MIGEKHFKAIRRICVVLFVVYIIVMAVLLFFLDIRFQLMEQYRLVFYNLVPFREIRRCVAYADTLGTFYVVSNLCGNILLFVPFGILCPELFRKFRRGGWTILAGVCLTVGVELLQFVTGLGCFDIDDIILNTAGTLIGFVIFKAVYSASCRFIRRKNADYRAAQAQRPAAADYSMKHS